MNLLIKNTLRGLAASVALLSLTNASAAVVFTETVLTGDAQVFNNGTLIQANNVGAGATATTINGVSFGNDHTGLTAPTLYTHSQSVSGFSTELSTMLNSYVRPSNWINSAFEYSGSLTISGLTIGNDYRIQLFTALTGASNPAANFSLEGSAFHSMTDWAPGAMNLSAVWTATDDTMNLTIGQTFSQTQYLYTVLNGYALHDVTGVDPIPETGAASVSISSTLGLSLFGVAGLIWRRRQA
ncbi:MAG: LPXTG cell wall anchor domain-containing protein [Gammaproteobacteria bacterium]